MTDTPWNTIDPLPAGKNQDIELLVKSGNENYREKAEQLMQSFSGLGTVDGTCSSAIDAETKTVVLQDYTLEVLPKEFSVTFTNANTYGNGTTTYPILQIYNSENQLLGSFPVANSRGRYAGNGAWEAGDILYFRVMAGRACIINSEISTTRDLQAKVKDMTLSALDLTEANKTLPVNSVAVNGALANYGNLNFVGTSYLSNSLDNAKTVGNYRVGSDATSKPYASAGYLSVMKRSDNLITQIFYGDNNLMAIRTFTTTWSNWQKYTTENELKKLSNIAYKSANSGDNFAVSIGDLIDVTSTDNRYIIIGICGNIQAMAILKYNGSGINATVSNFVSNATISSNGYSITMNGDTTLRNIQYYSYII